MSFFHIEIWERVHFDEQGRAIWWERSLNNGQSWKLVDCSLYPDGRPPFVRVSDDNAAWVERHLLIDQAALVRGPGRREGEKL